jgi:hypothetical protein
MDVNNSRDANNANDDRDTGADTVATAHSRQSARLSLQSSELAFSAHSPASECCPPPPPHWFQGGGPTHWRERAWGEILWTKRQALWYSRYIIIPLRHSRSSREADSRKSNSSRRVDRSIRELEH